MQRIAYSEMVRKETALLEWTVFVGHYRARLLLVTDVFTSGASS